MKQTLLRALAVASLVICASFGARAAQDRPSDTYDGTRKLLAALKDVRLNDDKLSALFQVGDRRITDLIRLLNDPDREISLRAQVVIRYLGNGTGMRALRRWYGEQRGEYVVAGPVPQPLDEWDYNNIKVNLIGNSPRTWSDEGVSYIYALALSDSPRAKNLLAELMSTARALDETTFVGYAIRRVQTSKPEVGFSSEEDLGKQVLDKAFFIAPGDLKYAAARVLALSEAKDKVLIEVHLNRRTFAEEWYHIVLKRCDQGWEFLSITPVAIS